MSKQRKAPKWVNERRAISTLTPYKHNPRVIKGKAFEDLKKSIENFGLVQPVVINTDGTIIGGHARFYYLQERGDEWVDCYVPDRELTEKEVQELNIRLNKNVAGEFDFEVLANYFETTDLEEWGFEKQDFGISMGDATEEEIKLPDGDKGEYKQITFTLHESQHALVTEMLEHAKQDPIKDTENENENGNALYTICKRYQNEL